MIDPTVRHATPTNSTTIDLAAWVARYAAVASTAYV
jgi:hypothetical protein